MQFPRATQGTDALILTGGAGTRLRPLTSSTLKPLLPLVNFPFLSYPISLLRKHGTRRVILCTGPDPGPYRSLTAREARQGSEVLCSLEPRPLGTGGAVKQAERFIRSSPFFLFNGDTLCDLDLAAMSEFHKRKRAAVTIGLVRVQDPSISGMVLADSRGRIRKFLEKPGKRGRAWINCGIYLFERSILTLIPKNVPSSAERRLFPELLRKNIPVFAFQAPGTTYWIDIGAPRKYLQANLDLLDGRGRGWMRLVSGRAVAPGTKIHPQARISKRVVLGRNCRVERGAVLDSCVVLEGTVIGEGAVVENCVVGENSRIGGFSRIQNAEVLGPRTRLTAYTIL